MLSIIHQFSTLSEIIKINILGRGKIGDYSSAVRPYGGHLCDVDIPRIHL